MFSGRKSRVGNCWPRWLRDDTPSRWPGSGLRHPPIDLLNFVVADVDPPPPESACPAADRAGKDLAGEPAGQSFWPFAVELDRELGGLKPKWRSLTNRPGGPCRCNPCRRGTRSGGVVRRPLRATLRGRYHGICTEVQELSDRVVRASSLVETSTAGCAATSSCGGSWGRTT